MSNLVIRSVYCPEIASLLVPASRATFVLMVASLATGTLCFRVRDLPFGATHPGQERGTPEHHAARLRRYTRSAM